VTVFETHTSLEPPAVLDAAKRFFGSRQPQAGAFPEKEGPTYLVLRGQGGEEIVISAVPAEGGSAVRASSMLFGQQVKRFFTTLPQVGLDDVSLREALGAGPV